MATDILTGDISNILNFLSAAAALGTAAMGLVDSSKVFCGGPSNFGFGYIKGAISPFLAQAPGGAAAFGSAKVLQTLNANWLNGVAIADQKAKAKALIHLGLTQGNAATLAEAAGVDGAMLKTAAASIATSTALTPSQIGVLGQFDAVLSAVLDAAYERGDQKYRNACKLLAMLVATVLGGLGGWLVYGSGTEPVSQYFCSWKFGISLLIGISATPLAPMAKDLATSLQTAVSAVRTI
ncbi:MAG: hypothetical protein ACHQRJ_01185 [Alphaproteobacteria bacterium]